MVCFTPCAFGLLRIIDDVYVTHHSKMGLLVFGSVFLGVGAALSGKFRKYIVTESSEPAPALLSSV